MNTNFEFGIDTIELVVNRRLSNAFNHVFVPTHYLDAERTKYKLNPDYINGGIRVGSYSAYLSVMNEALRIADIDSPIMRRIDFKYDCMNGGEFEENYKINKQIITAIATMYHNINSYESYDFVSQNKLSIRSQGKYWEMEYYAKEKQEPTSGIKARLEMRVKSGNNHFGDEQKYFKTFADRLDKSISKEYLYLFNHSVNDALLDLWNKENKTISRNRFIIENSGSIFSREQAEDLCYRLGYKDYKQTAAKLDIEFVKYSDLIEYKDKLIAAGNRYFDS